MESVILESVYHKKEVRKFSSKPKSKIEDGHCQSHAGHKFQEAFGWSEEKQ